MSAQLILGAQLVRDRQSRLRLATLAESAAQAAAAPAGYVASTDVQIPGAHLTDYVKAVWKQRWSAIPKFALLVLAATVYTFTATAIYERDSDADDVQ